MTTGRAVMQLHFEDDYVRFRKAVLADLAWMVADRSTGGRRPDLLLEAHERSLLDAHRAFVDHRQLHGADWPYRGDLVQLDVELTMRRTSPHVETLRFTPLLQS